jgi:hypothetical protein
LKVRVYKLISDIDDCEEITRPLKVLNECKTRWSSCLQMIHRIRRLEPFLKELSTKSEWKSTVAGKIQLDFNFLKEIEDILIFCHKVSTTLAGEQYPTMHLVIVLFKRLFSSLEAVDVKTSRAIIFKKSLIQSLKKRYEVLIQSPHFWQALIADPRHVDLLPDLTFTETKKYEASWEMLKNETNMMVINCFLIHFRPKTLKKNQLLKRKKLNSLHMILQKEKKNVVWTVMKPFYRCTNKILNNT